MGADGKLILKGVTVAVAGPLGPGWTDADVARWLGYHGGRFAPAVTDDVTHLLCTAREYAKPRKKQSAALRAALRQRRGPRRVHIVLRDWLEDSLHRRRRLREGGYRLGVSGKGNKKEGLLGEASALYHIYRDATGFAYRVTIRRDDAAAGIVGERYVLHLFESDARPHLYWFAARHYKSRVHTQGRDYRPSGSCQVFATEHGHFCAFFARKTGVAWDARMVAAPADGEAQAWFRYVKPAKDMPVGVIEDPNVPKVEGQEEENQEENQEEKAMEQEMEH